MLDEAANVLGWVAAQPSGWEGRGARAARSTRPLFKISVGNSASTDKYACAAAYR